MARMIMGEDCLTTSLSLTCIDPRRLVETRWQQDLQEEELPEFKTTQAAMMTTFRCSAWETYEWTSRGQSAVAVLTK